MRHDPFLEDRCGKAGSTFGWRPLSVLCLAIVGLLIAVCANARATAEEADRIAEVLELGPGMKVADVGAGSGEWSEELARKVGESGRVYATEVDEDDVEDLREHLADVGLENVDPVLGDQHETGLPADCCDAILLRLVYHHFTEPPRMRASLRRALRPGGLLAVIDLPPQEGWRNLPGVPDRGGHGIPPALLIAEMTAAGFEMVARYDDWDEDEEHYCVIFRRPEARG